MQSIQGELNTYVSSNLVKSVRSDRDLSSKLTFCTLAPQSRARTSWPAVERLRSCDLLFYASAGEVGREFKSVRFGGRKASRFEAS
jgi:thermostable 8-oxoguanine DNA glycosylase